MSTDEQKKRAAEKSLDYVADGMIVGLGTGSTAAHMVDLLGRRVADGLKVTGVPTSDATARQAEGLGIPLAGFDTIRRIDVTIDGADELDGALRLIKGGGGALLKEKIVASFSDRMVVIADAAKRVDVLGRFPLPVEVVPFAAPALRHRLADLGARAEIRTDASGQPFRTDENNMIVDCAFGRIGDAEALADRLNAMPGVVEHGLFIGLAEVVILGTGSGTEILTRP
jgi:ribose 5-phosphate isomerase A